MIHSFRAAGCITQSASNSTSQHVWISDALLADTFQRFTRCQRRQGSNVPGPLEARRRAARRRNTNLAYTGSSGLPADPVLAFGTGLKSGWWQKKPDHGAVSTPEDALTAFRDNTITQAAPQSLRFLDPRERQSVSPGATPDESWIRGTRLESVLRPTDTPRYGFNVLDNWLPCLIEPRKGPKELKHVNSRSLQDDFQQQEVALRQELSAHDGYTTDLDLTKLGGLIGQLNLDLRRFPRHSETIFTHLLDTNQSASLVADYLLEPLWNPPGSSNHKILVTYFRSKKIGTKIWKLCQPATCRAAQMGLISEADLKDILLLYSRLRLEDGQEVGHIDPGEWGLEACLATIDAIQASKVLRLNDLGGSFLGDLYSIVQKASINLTSAEILWKLSSCAHLSQVVPRRMEMMTTLCTNWIDAIVEGRADIDALTTFLLSRNSDEVRNRALFLATERLIVLAPEKVVAAKALQIWHDVLSALNSVQVTNVIIEAPTISSILESSTKGSDIPGKLIAVIWTAIILYKDLPRRERLLSRLELTPTLEAVFPPTKEYDNGFLAGRILLALHDLALPNKGLVASMIPFLTDRVIEDNGQITDSSAESTRLTRRVFMYLDNQSFYHNLRAKHNDELREIAESINSNIEDFQRISQTLITKNKKTFKVILRILHHNRELKLLLSCSWPRSDDPRHARKRKEEVSQAPAMLSLINHLAVIFAISPVVGARTAFRKVHWCYQFLIKNSAPITPVITRALWHAGVTRYGPGGTAVTLLKWVLHQVKVTEGEDVARRLLWSASFRDQRRETIRQLALSSQGLGDLSNGGDVPAAAADSSPGSTDLHSVANVNNASQGNTPLQAVAKVEDGVECESGGIPILDLGEDEAGHRPPESSDLENKGRKAHRSASGGEIDKNILPLSTLHKHLGLPITRYEPQIGPNSKMSSRALDAFNARKERTSRQ